MESAPLAVPIIAHWKNTARADLAAAYDAPVALNERASLDAAVERAREALPGRQLQFVAFPGSDYSTDNPYAVFFHSDTPQAAPPATPGGTVSGHSG